MQRQSNNQNKTSNQLVPFQKPAKSIKKKQRRPKASIISRNPKGVFATRQLNLNTPQMGLGAVPYYRILPGSTEGGIRVIGRDLLGTALSATSAAGAAVVQSIRMGVQGGDNWVTRLETFASLFDLWKIHKVSATFVSSQPTTAAGQLYLGVSREAPNFYSAPTTVAQVMRYLKAAMGPAYANITTETDSQNNQVLWYSTDNGGAADSGSGIPATLIVASDGFASAVVPGKILLDYDVEFSQPSAQ